MSGATAGEFSEDGQHWEESGLQSHASVRVERGRLQVLEQTAAERGQTREEFSDAAAVKTISLQLLLTQNARQ